MRHFRVMINDKVTLGVFTQVTSDRVGALLLDVLRRYSDTPDEVGFERKEMREGRMSKSMYNGFLDASKKGCYISVKVPADPTTKGQALHLNVRYMEDPAKDKSVNVFPTEKSGRGKFWSKSIHRTESESGRTSWAQRLTRESTKGLEMCLDKFGNLPKKLERLEEMGIDAEPYYFEMGQRGSYYKGYCNTPKGRKDKWKAEKNTCLNITAVRADDLDGVKHYITVPKKFVPNYDEIGFSEFYAIPNGICRRPEGKWYRVCNIDEPTEIVQL